MRRRSNSIPTSRAYSGLADAYLVMSDYGWTDPEEAGVLAKLYATKAIEIDNALTEAHASLGLALLNHSWDFGEAESELKRAIELKPNYPSAITGTPYCCRSSTGTRRRGRC